MQVEKYILISHCHAFPLCNSLIQIETKEIKLWNINAAMYLRVHYSVSKSFWCIVLPDKLHMDQ